MPVGRGGLNQGKDVFARYPSLTYSTIPEGLMLALVSKQVGRNGWAVMVALCRKVYADGKLGRASAEEIARRSGLTRYQMKEQEVADVLLVTVSQWRKENDNAVCCNEG